MNLAQEVFMEIGVLATLFWFGKNFGHHLRG